MPIPSRTMKVAAALLAIFLVTPSTACSQSQPSSPTKDGQPAKSEFSTPAHNAPMNIETIAEKLFFTTVRIEATSKGTSSTGTGFIFYYKHKEAFYPFIITNKHVVDGKETGIIVFHQGKDGKPLMSEGWMAKFKGFGGQWYGHPRQDVDVAILPLAPIERLAQQDGVSLFYRHIPLDLSLTQESAQALDALEEIVFIGYPNGIWDTSNFLPIIRKGTTASPISIDFQGRPVFLIDASVFPGSSGSPVFILNRGTYFQRNGTTAVGQRVVFLGIISSGHVQRDINEVRQIPTANISVVESQQLIDLGVVFKASTIIETIESFLIAREGLQLDKPPSNTNTPSVSSSPVVNP